MDAEVRGQLQQQWLWGWEELECFAQEHFKGDGGGAHFILLWFAKKNNSPTTAVNAQSSLLVSSHILTHAFLRKVSGTLDLFHSDGL